MNWKQPGSLSTPWKAFTSTDNFKSYEDLERRLNLVLGIGQRPAPTRPTVDDEEYEPVAATGGFNDADITASAPSPVKQEAVVDDDDALSYFARLAEE